MFSMSSQNTFGKVRLNDKVESRVRGDLYARFGGECLETYHCKKWQGAGCLAYVQPPALQADFHQPAQKRCYGGAYHRRGGSGREIGHELFGIYGVAIRQHRPAGQGET